VSQKGYGCCGGSARELDARGGKLAGYNPRLGLRGGFAFRPSGPLGRSQPRAIAHRSLRNLAIDSSSKAS
jgi:hypothetical protein